MRPAIAGHALNTTYTDVGSADIAYVHGWTVVGQCRSNCRGANICHPCKLDSSIPATDGPAIACRIINVLISSC